MAWFIYRVISYIHIEEELLSCAFFGLINGGNYPLKEFFPDLFRLAMDKEASVATYLIYGHDQHIQHCDPQLIRSF